MKKILITIFILALLALLAPVALLAATPFEEGLNTAATTAQLATEAQTKTAANISLAAYVGKIINIFFGLIGFIFFGFILLGGYYWMSAGGNDDKTKKAKEYISNAVIGLVIISLAYVLARLVIERLGALG
jgi:hypothetical protein